MTDWAKFKLTEELTVVVNKASAADKLGMTLAMFSDDVPHPRIKDMSDGMAAAKCGQLKPRDVLFAVDGTQCNSDAEAAQLLGAAGLDIKLTIRRDPDLQQAAPSSSSGGDTPAPAPPSGPIELEPLEGTLEKQSPAMGHPWQSRTVKADATKITYVTGKEDEKSIDMQLVKSVVVPDPSKLVFEVRVSGREYKFRAPDKAALDYWVKGLRARIPKNV